MTDQDPCPATIHGQPRVLVLGYGNPGRQDDGLGPAVAALIDRLGWPHVTAYDNYQLNIEDAMDVAEHDVVWFVDAARTGAGPYAVSDLSRDELLAAYWRLMIEKNAVSTEHIVAFAEVDRHPICIQLRYRIGASRMERRLFGLETFRATVAEHFACGCLVELGPRREELDSIQ